MTLKTHEIEDKLVSELEYVTSQEVTDPSVTLRELSMDEVDIFDLVDFIEEEFGVTVPEDEIGLSDSVTDVAELIKSHIVG